MCLFQLWFPEGICSVVELLGHMVVFRTFLVAQMVKYLSLGQEDPLEKEMATHSRTLAWKSHGHRILVDYSPWGHK